MHTKFWLQNLNGRRRLKWEDNIRTDLREIRWDCVDWMQLAQDSDQWQALVNIVMNLRLQ